MNKKIAYHLLFAIVIVCCGCKIDSIPMSNNIRPAKHSSLELTIKAQPRKYKINEAIPIECILENNTHESAYLHLKSLNYGWQLNVTGNGARMVIPPITPLPLNKVDFITLESGKKYTFNISLPVGVGGWHWYIEKPGDYTITLTYIMTRVIVLSASTEAINNAWYGKIISNSINITVAE